LATLAHKFDDLGSAKAIIGSGPFVVTNEVLGKEVDMVARKDYKWGPKTLAHQGRAYLDGIKYIVVGEDSVRIGSLLAGQADFIRQVQAYDEKQVEAQKYEIYASPTRGVNDSVAFRPENPLVADVRVRQALLHATNTKEIVQTLFSANYPRATSVVAATAAGYINLSEKLGYDPETSKKLLDEAGWKVGPDGIREKDGKKLILGAHVSPPQPQNQAVLQLLSQQWAKVGVKFNVLSGTPSSTILDNLDPLKTALVVAEVGRADTDVIKSQFHYANRDALLQKGGLSSKATFIDPQLNALLEAGASETDNKKRLALAGDAQSYLIDHAYVIPIFEEPQVFAGAPYVKDIGFEAVGRPSFYGTWIAKH
jgi:peptide/nickel transport system substrate-binding protein